MFGMLKIITYQLTGITLIKLMRSDDSIKFFLSINMERLNYKWVYLVLEDDNMALDVNSGGLAVEPLRESIEKLSYGDKIYQIISNLIL